MLFRFIFGFSPSGLSVLFLVLVHSSLHFEIYRILVRFPVKLVEPVSPILSTMIESHTEKKNNNIALEIKLNLTQLNTEPAYR